MGLLQLVGGCDIPRCTLLKFNHDNFDHSISAPLTCHFDLNGLQFVLLANLSLSYI